MDLNVLTVKELKEILRKKGLTVGGTKSELIKRIQKAFRTTTKRLTRSSPRTHKKNVNNSSLDLLTVTQLRDILRSNKLPVSGTKPKLIARIQKYDTMRSPSKSSSKSPQKRHAKRVNPSHQHPRSKVHININANAALCSIVVLESVKCCFKSAAICLIDLVKRFDRLYCVLNAYVNWEKAREKTEMIRGTPPAREPSAITLFNCSIRGTKYGHTFIAVFNSDYSKVQLIQAWWDRYTMCAWLNTHEENENILKKKYDIRDTDVRNPAQDGEWIAEWRSALALVGPPHLSKENAKFYSVYGQKKWVDVNTFWKHVETQFKGIYDTQLNVQSAIVFTYHEHDDPDLEHNTQETIKFMKKNYIDRV